MTKKENKRSFHLSCNLSPEPETGPDKELEVLVAVAVVVAVVVVLLTSVGSRGCYSPLSYHISKTPERVRPPEKQCNCFT